jgi:ubiquinone/menaquinone biosynthesis C-methylase UbiE
MNNLKESAPMKDSHFKMMSLIHDNPLRRRFNSPTQTLKAAGVRPGLRVLEIGCGPGFFTLPAAAVIGEKGRLYTIDIHPLAIERVREKLSLSGLKNVELYQADAANTGLPANSINLVLVFGVLHSLPLGQVFPEFHRLLRPGGMVAVDSHRKGASIMGTLETGGLFSYEGMQSGISRLQKKGIKAENWKPQLEQYSCKTFIPRPKSF